MPRIRRKKPTPSGLGIAAAVVFGIGVVWFILQLFWLQPDSLRHETFWENFTAAQANGSVAPNLFFFGLTIILLLSHLENLRKRPYQVIGAVSVLIIILALAAAHAYVPSLPVSAG